MSHKRNIHYAKPGGCGICPLNNGNICKVMDNQYNKLNYLFGCGFQNGIKNKENKRDKISGISSFLITGTLI